MAKKNILKKIVGVVLALALLSSVCIMPQATNEFLPDGAQTTLVYEFDFDTSTMTYGANVDGVQVCGGAYAQIAGKEGNGLKASIGDTTNYRSLAFNDPVNNKWLTLNAGSYYATYDYKVTAVKDTTTTATPILKFIKILKRDSGFWSNNADPNYQKSVSNDLIGDYDHLSTDWQQGGVYFDIDADNSWFGLIAYTLKAAVILDNIKIYKITGYAQPAVYDFDSHNFYDGWAQTASENTIDGLDGTTRNDQIAFLTLTSNTNVTGNGSYYNVVNVENGSSRSYFGDSTAVKYNNGTAYPGLAGSGHKNVLRFGWNATANKPDALLPRCVALNNGSEALTLNPGTYMVSFDYYVAGETTEATDVKMDVVYNFTNNINNSGFYVLGDSAANIYNVFSESPTKNKWMSASVEVTVDAATNGFGFRFSSAAGTTRGTEVFLDNIKIEVPVEPEDPGENTWNFDYGVNAVAGSNGKLMNSGSVYVVGGYNAEGTDGNVLKIAIDNTQYNGDDRAAALYSNGTYKLLNKGIYKVKFDYLYTDLKTTNGYDKTKGYIGFGTVKDTATFVGTAVGQLNITGKLIESTSLVTSETEKDKWYSAECKFTVSKDGLAFGIMCAGLGKAYCLDNIELEYIGENYFDFDAVNTKVGFDSTNLIGGSSVFGTATDTAQGKVLKMPADTVKYDGGQRGLVLNDGTAQSTITGGKFYQLSFKYKYTVDATESSENTITKRWDAKNSKFAWADTDTKIALFAVDSANLSEKKGSFADWNYSNVMCSVGRSALTADGEWQVYTSDVFLAPNSGKDVILGLSVTKLCGILYMDDILIKEVESNVLIESGDNFTVDGDYIIMNGARTTVGELKEGSKYGQSFVVTRGETVINDDEAFVATGDTVELKYVDIDTPENTISYDQKTVIVLNDVNCDGDVDILDLVIVKKAVKNLLGEEFTPAELRALKIADGGGVTDAEITALRTELLATGNVTINAQAVNSVNP